MQLTNFSFLNSRLDHMSAGAAKEVAMRRISSGNRLENGKTDAGALSASLRLRSSQLEMATKIMSNATRLKDVLIPLTQNHFRSFVLSPTL